ncbi:MAG: hypothetical protein H6612_13510 [Ignavibacteriales bacterium]|nr:hypothetical protein [Ignavibacteriales bacterium]MCB9209111.1 hypothetical protein [Ignavibacteriales bacterium]MCB9260357.1 hypothetical protein [Ignavibacteriales bacterium]
MIPNVIHFIYGLEEDFGGKPFSLIHFLSILTAQIVNKPKKIYFHYKYEPTGFWWEKSKQYLVLRQFNPRNEIFTKKLSHFAHKADIARLEILKKYGGIYFDIDVISINPLKPLLKYKCVMGREENVGLCNAVLLAESNSKFLTIWFDSYKSFDETDWNYHSVILPNKLAKQNKTLIHIEDEYSFFYPMMDDPVLKYLWNQENLTLTNKIYSVFKKIKRKLGGNDLRGNYLTIFHSLFDKNWHFNKVQNSYCIHLWETRWWADYLINLKIESLLTEKNNFSKLIRSIIGIDFLKALELEHKNKVIKK